MLELDLSPMGPLAPLGSDEVGRWAAAGRPAPSFG